MADNQPEGITFSTEEEPGHLAIQIASNSVHPWQRRKAGLAIFPATYRRTRTGPSRPSFASIHTRATCAGQGLWSRCGKMGRRYGAAWAGGRRRMVIRRMTGPEPLQHQKLAVGQTRLK